jgi:hypothetical protein
MTDTETATNQAEYSALCAQIGIPVDENAMKEIITKLIQTIPESCGTVQFVTTDGRL